MEREKFMFNRTHSKWAKVAFLLVLAALLGFPVSSATASADFEVPSTLNASNILPRELISGPHYQVREKVVSYGYMHNYVVDSDYGVFEVTGDSALRKLVKEIGAIAALQEVKKSEAYINGVRKAAAKPVEFGVSLITEPVDTVSGVPKGVAALFQNVKTSLTTQASKSEDSKVEQVMSVSSNKRQLARQLGVDVYSSNKVLQKELNSLAWATSLGSLTVSAALAPVGGPAVAAVSVTRTAQELKDLVSEYPPQKLRQINQQKLETMGVPQDLITRFLDLPIYTPTQHTAIVGSLEILSKAKGRDAFLRYALSADSEESADFFMYIAQIMSGYNAKVDPIQEISVYEPLVFARSSNGTVIMPLPLDYAFWTERASRRIPDAISSHKAVNPGSKKYEFWFTGTASKMVKDRSAKAGVKVVEKVGSRVELAY